MLDREAVIEAISEGMFHGMMKFHEFQSGQTVSGTTNEAPAKPKAKRAAKKAKKEPEPEVEELDDEEEEEADDELAGEAMDHETMMIAIKSLIANYSEGPEAGKELAIETLKAVYDVDKFKDLEPKVYAQVVTMMDEALT